jgi:hypothetical protein
MLRVGSRMVVKECWSWGSWGSAYKGELTTFGNSIAFRDDGQSSDPTVDATGATLISGSKSTPLQFTFTNHFPDH